MPTEPLGSGLLKGWRGHIAFQALRGTLPGGGELRPVSGTVKSDGQSLTFDAIKGGIGGGEATATIDARPSADGIALNARVQLNGVDGAALHYRGLAMPAGRASMQMTLASQGRSASALIGRVVRKRHRDAGIRCASPGSIRARSKLRSAPAMPARRPTTPGCGRSSSRCCRRARCRSRRRKFRSPSGTAGFASAATTLDADGARAIVSGGYDIPADQADIRASLASTGGRTGERPSGNPAVRRGLARRARSHRRRRGAVVMAGGAGDRSRNPPAGFDRARRAAAGVAGIDSAAGARAAWHAAGSAPDRPVRLADAGPRSAPASAEAQGERCRARLPSARQSRAAGGQPAGCAAAAADRSPARARRVAPRRRSRGRPWC